MESGRTRQHRRRPLGLEAPVKENLAQQIANAVALSLQKNSQGSCSRVLLGGKQGLLARKLRLAEQNVTKMAAYLRCRNQETASVIESQMSIASCADGECQNLCVICLEAKVDALMEALPCGHIFHAQCINRWLLYRRECPVDRRSVD